MKARHVLKKTCEHRACRLGMGMAISACCLQSATRGGDAESLIDSLRTWPQLSRSSTTKTCLCLRLGMFDRGTVIFFYWKRCSLLVQLVMELAIMWPLTPYTSLDSLGCCYGMEGWIPSGRCILSNSMIVSSFLDPRV